MAAASVPGPALRLLAPPRAPLASASWPARWRSGLFTRSTHATLSTTWSSSTPTSAKGGPPIEKTLKGQVALVTGASQGIGRAIAFELAAEAASICLVARGARGLEEVATAANGTATAVATYPTDLTRDEDLRNLAAQLQRDFGRLDILIHSAGIIALGPLSRAPVADFDSQYRANLRAPYALTQTLLPMLIASQGQVVFINSSVGLTTRADVCQYAATQHALKAVADSLRHEVNPQGVRVLTVHPGRTATPRQVTIHALEGKEYRPERLMRPEDVAAMVLSALRLPRTAEVTEISMRPFLK